MITPAFIAAFAGVLPEGGADVRAARVGDSDRIRRMLAEDASRWSDKDIDIVMSRAQTTIGGAETFKWILPAWLERSGSNPDYGWMTVSEVLADKLNLAGFDDWPQVQRDAVLPMLATWLAEQEAAHSDDFGGYDPDRDAAFRQWLQARIA